MKKASIIILSSLILFLLVSKSLTCADENGKGNEKKNENGAQVTFQEDTKTVENKNKIIIKIKSNNDKDNHGKSDEDNDDHKNENGKDVDEEDDGDNVTVSPTSTPEITITPTITPEVSPTTTPSGEPTITPSGTPIPTPLSQFNLNTKIKGNFTLDKLAAIFEGILNAIKNALGTI